MSLAATRWLIGRGPSGSAEDLYLHVLEDEHSFWSPDQNRALRFATQADAFTFALGLGEDCHTVEVSTALLAVPHDVDEDDEDEDRAAG